MDQIEVSMADRADVQIANYLNENLYHPRSSKHGDALCRYLLVDLCETCETFSAAAISDGIVYKANYTIDPDSPDRWNADLVVGPPIERPTLANARVGRIAEGDPGEIWMAIDAKTIMTEHGKARRNRQRDLNSFQDILHRKNHQTIVGGILIINSAQRFQTPLARRVDGITEHRNVERLVAETVQMMAAIPRAVSGHGGLEALGIIVVEHTNVIGEPTVLVNAAPAPRPIDALSYSSCLHDLCTAFTERFSV